MKALLNSSLKGLISGGLLAMLAMGVPAYAVDKEALKIAKEAAARTDQEVRERIDIPYGAGDRDFVAKVPLSGNETLSNTDVWVVYSNLKNEVAAANFATSLPLGRALKVSSDNTGEMVIRFIFPHPRYETPNDNDQRPKVFNAGDTVFYKLIKKRGTNESSGSVVEFTMPPKFTIAIMGDSFAAGEGAPHKTGALWLNSDAHRSKNSAKALAVEAFKDLRNDLAIESVNVSFSGAGIDEGIMNSQFKQYAIEPKVMAKSVKPQIQQVKSWLSENKYDHLDVVMLSVGINEIFFDDVVTQYFVLPNALDLDSKAQRNLDKRINELTNRYDAMHDNIDDINRGFKVSRVNVSQYPSNTNDSQGKLCGAKLPHEYGGCWNAVEVTSGVPEFKIIDAKGKEMNATIERAVARYDGWRMVDGFFDASKKHGLCNCQEPWFNTIGASIRTQGDLNGTWHPNVTGHANFKRYELNALQTSEQEIWKVYFDANKDSLKLKRPLKLIRDIKFRSRTPVLPPPIVSPRG